MDPTSGAPFWIVRDGLPAVYPKLKQDRRCDGAVIGGGITGALVASRTRTCSFSGSIDRVGMMRMARSGHAAHHLVVGLSGDAEVADTA